MSSVLVVRVIGPAASTTVPDTGRPEAASVDVPWSAPAGSLGDRWTAAYGSKDYSALDPTKEGRDPVTVKAVQLSDDRKTVVLEIPSLRPVMQMGIEMKLKAADGRNVETSIYNTINYVP